MNENPRPEEDDEREEDLEALDDLVHVAVVLVGPLYRAHGEGAREDREEAVAARGLRGAVGE